MNGLAAVAAWLQPALVVALAFRVAAGEADAPWLVLAALVAPLVALLAPPPRAASTRVSAVVAAVVVTLLLAADFLVAAEAATVLGAARWHGVTLAALPAVVIATWPRARALSPWALAAAALALLLAPAAVVVASGATPWSAWHRGALRAALTFSETSDWVLSGERFARPTTLRFADGQRVTALTGGVYRVVEREAASATVREWHLTAGQSLTLRPGDELTVDTGARLRFEAGRRVPGAPDTGVAWADSPARGLHMLPVALGALVTLVGGALALVPAPRPGLAAAVGPVAVLVVVMAALAWGVYAASAPDLALGGILPAPVLRFPSLALGAGLGGLLAVLTVLALVLMLATAAIARRERLAASPWPALEMWIGMIVVATAVAVWPLDPWRVLILGLGLAAAAWAPARLATSQAGAVAGPIVGGVVFAALAALPVFSAATPAWLEGVTRYPALVSLPLGWLAARALPAEAPEA